MQVPSGWGSRNGRQWSAAALLAFFASIILASLVSAASAGAVVVSTQSLPPATVGQPYGFSLEASGGVPPYSFTVSGLPNGLKAERSGFIQGTPEQIGSFLVTVTAIEGRWLKRSSVPKKLSMKVNPPIITVTAWLPIGNYGKAYFGKLEALGGNAPYTFDATGLPKGLHLDSATGLITGTPAQAGHFDVSVTATDKMSFKSQPKTISLMILPSKPVSS